MLTGGGVTSPEAAAGDDRALAKRLLIAAGLAVLAAALCYVLFIRTSLGQRFDHAAALGAQQQDPKAAKADSTQLSRITSDSFAVVLLIIVAIGALRRRLLLGLAAAVGAALAVILTDVLKDHILTRPYLVVSQVPKSMNTFPSGHTATAVGCAMALVLVVPSRWKGVVAVFAGAYGWLTAAQVQTAGWHRPSDAIGGALVAFALVAGPAGLLAWFRPVTPRPAGRHLPSLITLGLVGGLGLIYSVIGFVDVFRYVGLHDLTGARTNTTRNAAYFTGVWFTVAVVVVLLMVLLHFLGGVDLAGRRPGRHDERLPVVDVTSS